MKLYITPEIETLKFAIAEDVICTSGNIDDGGKPNGGDEIYDEDVVPIQ